MAGGGGVVAEDDVFDGGLAGADGGEEVGKVRVEVVPGGAVPDGDLFEGVFGEVGVVFGVPLAFRRRRARRRGSR